MGLLCSSTVTWTECVAALALEEGGHVFLNTTNPDQQCPGDWTLQIRSTEPRRQCEIHRTGCSSAVFNTFGISYSHVCGRVRGYQKSGTTAFFFGFGMPNSSIDSYYLSGVSLTHGPPGARQHIWSFAGGSNEIHLGSSCPCANRPSAVRQIPSFVGNDFFCESGNPSPISVGGFYPNDTLWDGEGCASPPCCELSYPPGVTAPWFCKQLPQTTTDDIEARICSDSINPGYDDTPVQLVELYVR